MDELSKKPRNVHSCVVTQDIIRGGYLVFRLKPLFRKKFSASCVTVSFIIESVSAFRIFLTFFLKENDKIVCIEKKNVSKFLLWIW